MALYPGKRTQSHSMFSIEQNSNTAEMDEGDTSLEFAGLLISKVPDEQDQPSLPEAIFDIVLGAAVEDLDIRGCLQLRLVSRMRDQCSTDR